MRHRQIRPRGRLARHLGLLVGLLPYPTRRASRVRPALERLEPRRLLTGYFKPVAHYPLGDGISGQLVSGDFDGDDRPDLAVARISINNNLSILPNAGAGTFGIAQSEGKGYEPGALVSGRFDADDTDDLIVAHYWADEVAVYLGDGDGSLGWTSSVYVAGHPSGMAAGDFDGDGHLDLAVSSIGINSLMPRIRILLGVGDGTFRMAPDVVGFAPNMIAAADFDGDGRLDLAVKVGGQPEIKVLLGRGDGTFEARGSYSVGIYSNDIVAADFDGDGAIDLAVANYYGNDTISVLAGVGDGAFLTAREFESGAKVIAIAAADFNADGRADLAVANDEGETVGILLADDKGGFHAPRRVVVGALPFGLVARDFDGDGRPDIATTVRTLGAVGVLINSGDFDYPAISAGDASVAEGDDGETEAVFRVRLTEPSGHEVRVDYAVVAGTAQAPGDFTPSTGTLSFAPGETEKEVRVAVRGDFAVESDETLFLDLANPSGGEVVRARGVATILDDDATLSWVSDLSVSEGDDGTVEFAFELALSRPLGRAVTATFASEAVSAGAGDFAPVPATTLVFQPGETSKTIRVAAFGDAAIEADETFDMVLFDIHGVVVEYPKARGTIRNDDTSASLLDTSIGEGHDGAGRYMAIPVVLAAPSSRRVAVSYEIVDGTATAGADYLAASGMLMIDPGAVSNWIYIWVVGDRIIEGDEDLHVRLTAVENASITRAAAVGTIFDDDFGPKARVEAAEIREGDAASRTLTIRAVLSEPAAGPVRITGVVYGGTAARGIDFIDPGPISFTFEPGQTVQTTRIGVFGDRQVEADETIAFRLFNPVGGLEIEGSGATIFTIRDDDTLPRPAGDYDGDRKSDPVVFEPSTATFYIARSELGNIPIQFGIGSNFGGNPIPVPADYDGDALTDPGVFEPSTSTFYIARSGGGNLAIQFGIGTLFGGAPIPVPGDYDGDGRTDPAVFEPSTATFYVARSALGNAAIQFGIGTLYGGRPTPVAGDYDGDGRTDPAVFEPSTSTFYLARSSAGNVARQFGIGSLYGGTPTPTPADFDGDGRLDAAVFEPSTSTFYLARSTAGNVARQFGIGIYDGGAPVAIPGDFDGDGKADPAVFEPSTSTFYLARSAAGNVTVQFGIGSLSGGRPIVVPADFDGDGRIDAGVFEPSTSTFYIARSSSGNAAIPFGIGTLYGGDPIPLPSPPGFPTHGRRRAR